MALPRLSAWQKLKHLTIMSGAASAVFAGICTVRGNERFYADFLMPHVVHRFFEPEHAHNLAVWAAKRGLLFPGLDGIKTDAANSIEHTGNKPSLEVQLFGHNFENCLGLAAGFDKDAVAVAGMAKTGLGFVEIGSVTPHPQPGNEKPRVFRLKEDFGIINRYGFNSEGHDRVQTRLREYQNNNKNLPIILGVNLGKNKLSDDPVDDYVRGVRALGPFADYLVINVSSPNTPGLRAMQSTEVLRNLTKSVQSEREKIEIGNLRKKVPILLKVAPDLTEQDKKDIAKVALDLKIDGLIVSNTTITRPKLLTSECKNESGGLSGKPLKDLATKAIGDFYQLTQGKIPIIGVGGVFSGQDAFEKICAGASLIQIYSALIYEGPPVVNKIKRQLQNELQVSNFKSVAEAVGSKWRDI